MGGWLPKSSSAKQAKNVKENDAEIREAVVWLYTRPVGGRKGKETEFRHWSLIFEFSYDSIRRVEGNENGDELVGYFYKESAKVQGKYVKLTTLKTSPKLLREAAEKNPLNYSKYNCQDWVKQFAKSLGNEELIQKLENYKSLSEAYPVFAIVVASWEHLLLKLGKQ